jgi:hypothetical protein
MVKVRKDLTGQKFGRLTVICQTDDYVGSNGVKYAMWHCVCDCDEHREVDVLGINLKQGRTKSCGCLQKDKIIERCRKYNIYDLSKEYGVGYTTNTNLPFYFDKEYFDKIQPYCWQSVWKDKKDKSKTYVRANIKGVMIEMQNFLLPTDDKHIVDHKNRNGMDNRLDNLRICTWQNNTFNQRIRTTNTSGVIGVFFNNNRQSWVACLEIGGKKYCRYFKSNQFETAVKTRLQMEADYFGEFAPQKHLFEKYKIKYNDKEII